VDAHNIDNYINVYLVGMDYPADTSDILYTARVNRAPAEFLNVLETLPNYVFDSPADIYQFVMNQVSVQYLR
jgi:hypothetical protein